MSIHGKTLAKAKKMGIRLTETEDGQVFAKAGKYEATMATAKEAIVEIEAIRAADPDKAKTMRALALAKPEYAARGDVNNCGDWLAITLKEAFLTNEGKKTAFDMDGFIHCLKDNGVKVEGRWADNRNPGWQGRFRMNGRQKLEIVISANEVLVLNGKKIKPPKAFVTEMQAKHPIEEEADEVAAA